METRRLKHRACWVTRKLRLIVLVAACLVAVAPPPARADEALICASLSYYAFGTEHSVLTNWCPGPQWFGTFIDEGPECLVEPPPAGFDVCYEIHVATP